MGVNTNKIYKHVRTGNFYRVTSFVDIKIDGEWVKGVLYAPATDYSKNYVRVLKDFIKKFEEVSHDDSRDGRED